MVRVWSLPCWDLTETSKRDDGIDLLKDNQALHASLDREKAKMDLSSLTQTNISFAFHHAIADGPKHIETTITRAKFEELCSDLLDRMVEVISVVMILNVMIYARLEVLKGIWSRETPLKAVFDEFSIVDEHLSEPEETLYVSSHEPDITIAQYDDDEAEKEIEVISERSEEPQKENEEDQPLVLVKPPTLPCIFVRPCKGVDVKERSRIFYTVDTFVLDDHDSTDSFVLEVPNELPTLKEGAHDALPKYVDAPFVVDISKGEGIT
ncbi:hypothetical protein Syun_012612 [Stephania yunnanensis]|uniref:Uncharacterized protein n=1 Tax=Stephania yunnanensis TaxID=152371 RepID=A0AAP0PGJ5_9MAGN